MCKSYARGKETTRVIDASTYLKPCAFHICLWWLGLFSEAALLYQHSSTCLFLLVLSRYLVSCLLMNISTALGTFFQAPCCAAYRSPLQLRHVEYLALGSLPLR